MRNFSKYELHQKREQFAVSLRKQKSQQTLKTKREQTWYHYTNEETIYLNHFCDIDHQIPLNANWLSYIDQKLSQKDQNDLLQRVVSCKDQVCYTQLMVTQKIVHTNPNSSERFIIYMNGIQIVQNWLDMQGQKQDDLRKELESFLLELTLEKFNVLNEKDALLEHQFAQISENNLYSLEGLKQIHNVEQHLRNHDLRKLVSLMRFQIVKKQTSKQCQELVHEMIEKLPTKFELLQSHLIYHVMLLQLKVIEQAILNNGEDCQVQISDLVKILIKAEKMPAAFEVKTYQILKCWLQGNKFDQESALKQIVQLYPYLFRYDFSQDKLRCDLSDAKRRLIKQFLVTLLATNADLTKIGQIKVEDILNDILETVVEPSLGHRVKLVTSYQIKKVLQILNSIVFLSSNKYPAIILKIYEQSQNWFCDLENQNDQINQEICLFQKSMDDQKHENDFDNIETQNSENLN